MGSFRYNKPIIVHNKEFEAVDVIYEIAEDVEDAVAEVLPPQPRSATI